jgi:hypothetical protein
MTYTYTGAIPDTLDSGRPLLFGDTVSLSKRQAAANRRLIDAGLLRPVSSSTTSEEGDQ